MIASPGPGAGDEQVALVDFLTRKGPERFKAFYVEVIALPDRKTIERAGDNAYQVSLAPLETEWQRFRR